MTNDEDNDEELESTEVFVNPTDDFDLRGYNEDTKYLSEFPYRRVCDAEDDSSVVQSEKEFYEKNYSKESRDIDNLLHRLERISEKEAIGMLYVGSLAGNIELKGTDVYWSYEGRSELRSRFERKLDDIKERLEPTHYSLDVRFAERVSNYYTRYSIFANFYRRDAK